jgi:hypothetical protein
MLVGETQTIRSGIHKSVLASKMFAATTIREKGVLGPLFLLARRS